jgi:hypothetical protein
MRVCIASAVATALLAPLLALVGGCGQPAAPQRHTLSGRVTFDGRPLPQGRISFDPVEPVEWNGKRVGGGFAPIRDGEFRTNVFGRGHLGGPHRIVITGHAAEPIDPQASEPVYPRLFEPYELTGDLPRKTASRDFVVPAGKP